MVVNRLQPQNEEASMVLADGFVLSRNERPELGHNMVSLICSISRRATRLDR
jgi:hypothetical protein